MRPGVLLIIGLALGSAITLFFQEDKVSNEQVGKKMTVSEYIKQQKLEENKNTDKKAVIKEESNDWGFSRPHRKEEERAWRWE